jgi:hypothetical protein
MQRLPCRSNQSGQLRLRFLQNLLDPLIQLRPRSLPRQ